MPMNPVAPKVIIIPAKQELAENRTIKRQLRVAAYCRVSTDDEEQLTSYEAQQTYYTDKIMTNPDWTMAGIYADEGITGTKATKRPEFLKMIRKCKQKKIDLIARNIPDVEVQGNPDADTLLIGWGGTYGHLYTAVEELNRSGKPVAFAHFRYICPLPANTAEVISRYKRVIVAELNKGQFADYLQAKNPMTDIKRINKVQGQPFLVQEIIDGVTKIMEA